MSGNKNKKRCSYLLTAVLCICILAVVSVGAVTLARYVMNKQGDEQITSDKFYFTSDYLVEGGKTYTVYENEVTVTLRNNDGANSSDGAITYTLTVDGAETSHTIGTGAQAKTHTVSGTDGQSITVTATSTSPYAKTLSATFVFKNPGTNSYYKLTSHGHYCVLDIFTGATVPTDGKITIAYNALIPDTTDDRMSKWVSATSGSLDVVPYAHYQLVFFGSHDTVGDTVFTGSIELY